MKEIHPHKTEPWEHQREVFNASKDLPAYALFWEQGTGKTKPTIDTIAHLWLRRKIDAAIIVSPNNVHAQWVNEQIPKHMPDVVAVEMETWLYEASKSRNMNWCRDFGRFCETEKLAILSVGYGALNSGRFKELIEIFMEERRRIMLILDESHYIQTPGAKRTKSLTRLGKHKKVKYKRILTGTPLSNGPFPAYAQMKFLDDDFWRSRNLASYATFKSYFAEIYRHPQYGYEIIKGYVRLDELYEMLQALSSRITKEDALPGLPPKVYDRLVFEMGGNQKRHYENLRDHLFTVLQSGAEVTVDQALSQLLRMQQVLCGYLPTPTGIGKSRDLQMVVPPTRNPRLNAAVDFIHASWPGQGIVWARFTKDIDLLCERLESAQEGFGKASTARYDGGIPEDEAAKNLEAFKAGDRRVLVANPAKGATGLNLQMARSVMYYSNSFNLTHRLQSEDRCHRGGQTNKVIYTDVVCPGTIDERILANLRAKKDLASIVLGDDIKEWI